MYQTFLDLTIEEEPDLLDIENHGWSSIKEIFLLIENIEIEK